MKSPFHDTIPGPEKACLVGFDVPENFSDDANISLTELEALAETAGVVPTVTLTTKLRKINPKFLVGSGKVEQIKAACKEHDIHLVIFDRDLSPAQTRNLEHELEAKIIDRTALILDIFAKHARTREGKLQIELAQLEYLLPRLTKLWTHLSRQHGGMGTKGPGEKQLEVDRRQVQTRISHLNAMIDNVRKQRATQRKQRSKSTVPVIAIVGYTNAGKSTLLQALTKADIIIEDKLFATLDTTSRVYTLPTGEKIVFIDTVGFIRNLPHTLVESFKATLEETEKADVLLHLSDASASDIEGQIKAVNAVLSELDASDKPQLLVLNKADVLTAKRKAELKENFPEAAFISAMFKYGFSDLLEKLKASIPASHQTTKLRLPPHKSDLLSELHQNACVVSSEYLADAILVEAYVPDALKIKCSRYRIKET